jgi:hypothetical protein
MLNFEEYICPLCGLVLSSLFGFHKHVREQHEDRKL